MTNHYAVYKCRKDGRAMPQVLVPCMTYPSREYLDSRIKELNQGVPEYIFWAIECVAPS